MRLALLCDVDQAVYHVGDEAIGRAGAAALRARGHEVLSVSRRQKHGPGGIAPERSIPALTFPWAVPDRLRYLDEVRRVLAGERAALPPDDKLFDIIDAFGPVDGLVIGGGGALNSRYGWLLTERLATAMVARAAGVRVVLSGQSIGPELSAGDRELVGELLDLCTLAGVRDADSLAIARSLRPQHPALHLCPDDAAIAGPAGEATADRISVTLGADPSPFSPEASTAVMARVVDALASATGAAVELVPHMADPDVGGADLVANARLAERLRAPVTLAPIELSDASAARTADARWVVSTRFHPAVFGTLAGAGTLAVPLNRYGISRMRGALAQTGWSHGVVPLAALWRPGPDAAGGGTDPVDSDLVDAVVGELLARSDAERAHLQAVGPRLLSRAGAWWDAVSAAVAGEDAAADGAARDSAAQAVPLTPRWGHALRERLHPSTPPEPGDDAAEAPPAPASVSIITRTKDRPFLLDRAVQDVLAQTRTDWEMLVVDDAGAPGPVDEVLARWEHEAAGRIRVLHRESSRGMEDASNAGLAASDAPLVAIHDDDDTWAPTFLQEATAHLGASPEDLAVAARTEIVYEHEHEGHLVEDSRVPFWQRTHGMRLLEFVSLNHLVPIGLVHRRRVHDEIGLFDPALPVVGDWDFHLRLLRHGPVGFLDRPLAQWRQRPGAEGASGNSVLQAGERHEHYDAELRERHFQAWVQENGLGLPLFIARTVREELGETETRLRGEIDDLRGRLDHVTSLLDGATGLLEETADRGRRAESTLLVRGLRKAERLAKGTVRTVLGPRS